MNLTLSCRWFRLHLDTERTPSSAAPNGPKLEANNGGVFEIDGQPDARELFTQRLTEPLRGVGFSPNGGI